MQEITARSLSLKYPYFAEFHVRTISNTHLSVELRDLHKKRWRRAQKQRWRRHRKWVICSGNSSKVNIKEDGSSGLCIEYEIIAFRDLVFQRNCTHKTSLLAETASFQASYPASIMKAHYSICLSFLLGDWTIFSIIFLPISLIECWGSAVFELLIAVRIIQLCAISCMDVLFAEFVRVHCVHAG